MNFYAYQEIAFLIIHWLRLPKNFHFYYSITNLKANEHHPLKPNQNFQSLPLGPRVLTVLCPVKPTQKTIPPQSLQTPQNPRCRLRRQNFSQKLSLQKHFQHPLPEQDEYQLTHWWQVLQHRGEKGSQSLLAKANEKEKHSPKEKRIRPQPFTLLFGQVTERNSSVSQQGRRA